MYTGNAREATITKLERKTIKNELLLTTVKDKRTGQEVELEDYFVFQAKCVRKFGAAPGIYVRQLVFWDGLGMDPDGWIYKSEDEMEAETGLRRHAQRKARAALVKHEVLEEKRHGLPCRLYYRVNLEKLAELLEDPHSTWNQWRRGLKKNPETGKFHRPEEPTLNHDSREDRMGSEQERTPCGPDKEGPYTDPTSEDRIGTGLERTLYGPDKFGPHGVPAITENTRREDVTDNPESTSEVFSESSVLQTGANGSSSRPTPPQTNKNISQDSFEDEGQERAHPTPTTSLPPRPEVESRLLSEVRRVMKNGRHSPVALKHYRAGSVSVEEVAEFVSQDARGNMDAPPALVQAVRRVLDEDASESRAL